MSRCSRMHASCCSLLDPSLSASVRKQILSWSYSLQWQPRYIYTILLHCELRRGSSTGFSEYRVLRSVSNECWRCIRPHRSRDPLRQDGAIQPPYAHLLLSRPIVPRILDACEDHDRCNGFCGGIWFSIRCIYIRHYSVRCTNIRYQRDRVSNRCIVYTHIHPVRL